MTPDEAVAKLNDRQRSALLCDERAIEQLSTEDRDGIIVLGIACRAWPQYAGGWRTWVTAFGVEVRKVLAPKWTG
jgi:hypothetical protein